MCVCNIFISTVTASLIGGHDFDLLFGGSQFVLLPGVVQVGNRSTKEILEGL